MGDWQSIFKKQGRVFTKVQEEMREASKVMRKAGARRVLDLGCGSGRHTIFLAKEGFEIVAADISEEGLELTRRWLAEKKLTANTKEMSCYKRFPFKDDTFDAVISTQVIHHNMHDKVKLCISEIERVLKDGGITFISVAAKKNWMGSGHAKTIAPRTYIPLDGTEKGLPHFIYNKELLRKDFGHFKIIRVGKDKGNHYYLLGKLMKKKSLA
jgi:ubiquinone/menaquinone biosynthesis C-methylase UbiE